MPVSLFTTLIVPLVGKSRILVKSREGIVMAEHCFAITDPTPFCKATSVELTKRRGIQKSKWFGWILSAQLMGKVYSIIFGNPIDKIHPHS